MKYVCIIYLFLLSACSGKHFYHSVSLSTQNWKFKSSQTTTYFKAQIPGTIHTDLLQNNLIPNPFLSNNEQQLHWIEDSTWEYTTKFTLTATQLKKQHIELLFDGLDTYAKVTLNNTQILLANNMFKSWLVNVKPYIKAGENTLQITFEPTAKKAAALAKLLPYTLPGENRVHVRKAQYHFGWDWGPTLITCGIWKNVSLQFWNTNKLENIRINQRSVLEKRAQIDVVIQTSTPKKSTLKASLWFEGTKISEQNYTTSSTQSVLTFTISNPQLWWCNGMGKANVYQVKVELLENEKSIQQLQSNFGLRTIELVQQADSVGKSFYFKLNGKPVFAKGANVIPFDVFLPRVKHEQYETLIKQATSANINMLRVWGGGVYEHDDFYDLCDQHGIMVWQDFMFACGMYPGDTSFLNNVKTEVEQQVIRLRNHACIALWCGNNENIEGWYNWGWQKQYNYSYLDSVAVYSAYDTLFHHIISKVILDHDAARFYHPSSPANGWGKAKSLTEADVHYWGVWWGMQPFNMYEKKVGRFVSEYGFQSLPSERCMDDFADRNEWSFSSPAFKNHQKHPTGFETITHYMEQYFSVPKSVDEFAYRSQLTQAIGMETAITAHRINKPYCMGSLYWQLNDCWPVTSWSTTDYYNQPKAAYYAIKKAFSPVALLHQKDSNELQLYLVSDLPYDTTVVVTINHYSFNSDLLSESKEFVQLKANVVMLYNSIKNSQLNSKSVLKVSVEMGEKIMYENYIYTKTQKELPLQKSNLKLDWVNDSTLRVTCTKHLGKSIFLQHPDLIFADNNFDLLPGESKLIAFRKLDKNPTSISEIKCYTLWDD